MTRNSALRLEDLVGCKHRYPIPIVDDATGEILFWKCPCGAELRPPPKTEASTDGK